MPEKKKADYSASAVNLTNPPEVSVGFACLKKLQEDMAAIEKEAFYCVPQELRDRGSACLKLIAEQEQGLRTAIDTFGSYQDVEAGNYALKQRKVSVTYDPKRLREVFPAEAALVIEESVNTTKIKGLIKGGLLNMGDLGENQIIHETESFAYIIK